MTDSASAVSRGPVYDFDYHLDPRLLDDVHDGYLTLKKEAPPVFWTPHHGGHWVAMTTEAATKVLRHPETFSSRYLSIPPNPNQPKMIPESLDPPEHKAYRQMLRPFFESKAIAPLEPRIVEWTERLIADVAPMGQCDFVEALASRLPVSVFMEMFGFPLDRFEEFRSIVVRYFNAQTAPEERMALSHQILGILAELIQSRMAEPKADLISTLIAIPFEGRRLTFDELMSIAFLMFLAGLDTVTNAMTFGMRHLAGDAALRQRIIDDPACIPNAVEELMRRYTFVSTPRYVVEDTVLEGVQLKAGDSILVPLHVVGLDPKLNPEPEKVSVDRPAYRHAGFGSGVHTCLGLHLARMELVIFYRVWFERIGHFRLADPDAKLTMRAGSVQAIESLPLAWN
jgi:cytochrome P450